MQGMNLMEFTYAPDVFDVVMAVRLETVMVCRTVRMLAVAG